MTSAEIRQSFLDFFKSKGHTIVPSSSLMPDSPGLLFTNAGMNQFVPIFLNERAPDVDKWPGAIPAKPTRAADTQKCIRAGGKHNDLEDVGLDTYHHTFFEMLGNWSFGDYFKKEAIAWAWELVAGIWKFPPQRLYATVYSPEKANGDPSEFDQDAFDFWAAIFTSAGLDPKVHIVHGGKKDNFWMMGETGPCGPCSEIHVDLTPAGDTQGSLVNKGDARCIEIWNLVFIQFNANPDGTFSPLPAKHVDTGMGFERVTGILQNTNDFKDFSKTISNYETDIFRPLFDKLEKLSGKKYGSTLPQQMGSAVVPTAPAGVPPAASGGTIYHKRRLPHFERPWAKYMVSFSTHEHRQLSAQAREIALKSLLFGHEQRRYQLYAACVMPDHVHFLFEPQIKEQDQEGKPVFWSLSELLRSIKSFTAHEINKLENSTGQLWGNESFDRMLRGDADLEEKFHYICRNPWDSGIVPPTENYPWLWTPDAQEAGARDARQGDRDGRAPQEIGSAVVPTASAGVPPADSAMGEQIQIDIAFRVIADHIRTLSFSIADGILPGNNDRNYVLRRILRRAVRYGRTLGFHEPFFYKLVEVLAEKMGEVFPDLRKKQSHIQEVIKAEEEAFNKTLDRGIQLFENEVFASALAEAAHGEGLVVTQTSHAYIGEKPEEVDMYNMRFLRIDGERTEHSAKFSFDELRAGAWKSVLKTTPIISGKDAFKLYDTYGFPLDLTELMARERGFTVNNAGFDKLMEEQRARARAAQKKEIIAASNISTSHSTRFVGFDTLETITKILEVVEVNEKPAVIVETTGSYAEMGGQVGDTGNMQGDQFTWEIVDTQKTGNTYLHFLGHRSDSPGPVFGLPSLPEFEDMPEMLDFIPQPPEQGAIIKLCVNAPRRHAIQRHHSVTHLLHWALHEVASPDATQKGSYVGPEKLTFDFSSAPLTPAQVGDVEKLVNERILENAGVTWNEVPYAQVKGRKDIMQFFGEKYGDVVRVVQIGGQPGALNGYSMELCGGTHTRATGEIGLFRIVSEGAVAAGIRRIEAVAGLRAYDKTREDAALIASVAGKINAPVADMEKKIESLLAQQKDLEKQLHAGRQKQAAETARGLVAKASTAGVVPSIVENLGAADGDFLQSAADALKGQFKGVIVLAGTANGAVALVAAVSPEFTAKFQAGKIMQAIAPILGGKGGGRPDNARGGGKDVAKIDEALQKARALLGT
jgi:alanyl-tRNA synthetase/REP element-mobilizing transposase RayT